MELIYCPNCEKRSGFKRALGFGTFFMVLITLGLWLLAIPFYPARCINCGLTRGSAFWENLRSNPRRAVTVSSVIAGLVVLLMALLSGYKWNRFSCLQFSSKSSWEPDSWSACKMGVFSKSVTLRICRIW